MIVTKDFDDKVALQVGVAAAIVYRNIQMWSYGGARVSMADVSKAFGWSSPSQVKTSLKRLENVSLLSVVECQKSKYIELPNGQLSIVSDTEPVKKASKNDIEVADYLIGQFNKHGNKMSRTIANNRQPIRKLLALGYTSDIIDQAFKYAASKTIGTDKEIYYSIATICKPINFDRTINNMNTSIKSKDGMKSYEYDGSQSGFK